MGPDFRVGDGQIGMSPSTYGSKYWLVILKVVFNRIIDERLSRLKKFMSSLQPC
jgi:hypothetical protein